MQPDALEGQQAGVQNRAPRRRLPKASKSLSRLATSSSNQSTTVPDEPAGWSVPLANRSKSARVKRAVAWDAPSPPAHASRPPARSGSGPHEALHIESWQPLRSGSSHFRGPPSVGSTATLAHSSGSAFRRGPLKSSSASQLYLPDTILTLDHGSDTTRASMSSNSGAPVRWLDSGSWRGTPSTQDRSSLPSHRSQGTSSQSTYHSGSSQPSNVQGPPPQQNRRIPHESSFSFGSNNREQQPHEQQELHNFSTQPYLLGAANANVEDLVRSSASRSPGRDTIPGQHHALEPQSTFLQVRGQPSAFFQSSNSSRIDSGIDSRESFQDAASHFEEASHFEAASVNDSSNYEDEEATDEEDRSDTPPPSAFSIMAAALGWSVGYARKGMPHAHVEGDMFGLRPPAAEDVALGRADPRAEHAWEEQQHQSKLCWLADTHQLRRHGAPRRESARQAERSSALANQVGGGWDSLSPHPTPAASLSRGRSLPTSSGSPRSSALKGWHRSSHRGSHRRRSRSTSKRSSGHSWREHMASSPRQSPRIASTMQAVQQQQRSQPRPKKLPKKRATTTCIMHSRPPPSRIPYPLRSAPLSNAPFGAAPFSSAPYSSASRFAHGVGTDTGARHALHAHSLGRAASPTALVRPASCNLEGHTTDNNNNENSSTDLACMGGQSPCEEVELSEAESLPVRASPAVSAPQLPSNLIPFGITDFGCPPRGITTTAAATTTHGSTPAMGEALARSSSSRHGSTGGMEQEQMERLPSMHDTPSARATFSQVSQKSRASDAQTSDMHASDVLTVTQLAFDATTSPPSTHTNRTKRPSSFNTWIEPGEQPAQSPLRTGSEEVRPEIKAQQNSGLQAILSHFPLERSLTSAVGGASPRKPRPKQRPTGVRFQITSPTSPGLREELSFPAAPDRKDSTDVASKDLASSTPSRPSPLGGSDSEENAGVHPDCQSPQSRHHSLERLQKLDSKKSRGKHINKLSGASSTPTSVFSVDQSPRPRRPSRPVKAYSMPKQLPYYSDLARHQGRCKVLLVTSDESKAAAIHMALPTARYGLIVASSKGQCMSYLTSGGAKYMPDILLLDSRWRAAQAVPGSEELDVSAGNIRGHYDGELRRGKRRHRQQTSPALELLATLRAYHDPSVLPIILLAAGPPPNPAMASAAAAELKDSTSRAAAAAPAATTAATTTTKTSTSHGLTPGSPSQASQAPSQERPPGSLAQQMFTGTVTKREPHSCSHAHMSQDPGAVTSQGQGLRSWSQAPLSTPIAPASADNSHSAPLPVFSSSDAPRRAMTAGQEQVATKANTGAALSASVAAPQAASEAAAPSHPMPGMCWSRILDCEHWDQSSMDIPVLSQSPSPRPSVPSTPSLPSRSNTHMNDQAVQQQLGVLQGPPAATAAAQTLPPGAAQPLQPSRMSAPRPATCASTFPSSSPSMTGLLEQAQPAEPPFTPSAAQEGVAALRQGANDYVTMPMLDPAELEARISTQVALRRAVRIKAEASTSMQLLRSMLPSTVIRRLKAGQTYIAQRHEEVTIGFIDVVGFTDMSAHWHSSRVAQMLNDLFSRFDDICDHYGVYHVDTIGDSYMVLCGHDGEQDHALRVMRMAADMLELTEQNPLRSTGELVRVRIGLNTGPAHSGVLGTRRLKYTVWGDSVNLASRMESSGFAGSVQISSHTYQAALKQMGFFSAKSQASEEVPSMQRSFSRSSTAKRALLKSASSRASRAESYAETHRALLKSASSCASRAESFADSSCITDHLSRSSAKSTPATEHTSCSKSGALERSSEHSNWPEDIVHEENVKRGEEAPYSSDHGPNRPVVEPTRSGGIEGGEWHASVGGQGSDAAGVGGVPWEFEFVPLGERPIKGKGMVSTYLVKVGKWMDAYETYVHQQQAQHASLRTPEGEGSFSAGQASGYSDGYQSGYSDGYFTACSMLSGAEAGFCRGSPPPRPPTPSCRMGQERHPTSDIGQFCTRSSPPALRKGIPQHARIVYSTPVSPWSSRQGSLAECPSLLTHAPPPTSGTAAAAAAGAEASESSATWGPALGAQQTPHLQASTSTHAHAPQLQQEAPQGQAGCSKKSNQANMPAPTQQAPQEGAPAHAASMLDPSEPASHKGRGEVHLPQPMHTHATTHAPHGQDLHPPMPSFPSSSLLLQQMPPTKRAQGGGVSSAGQLEAMQLPSAHIWHVGNGAGLLSACERLQGDRSAPLPVVTKQIPVGMAHRCSRDHETAQEGGHFLVLGTRSSTDSSSRHTPETATQHTFVSLRRFLAAAPNEGMAAIPIEGLPQSLGDEPEPQQQAPGGAPTTSPRRSPNNNKPQTEPQQQQAPGGAPPTSPSRSPNNKPQPQWPTAADRNLQPLHAPGSAFASSPAAKAAAAAAAAQARSGASQHNLGASHSRTNSMQHFVASASLSQHDLAATPHSHSSSTQHITPICSFAEWGQVNEGPLAASITSQTRSAHRAGGTSAAQLLHGLSPVNQAEALVRSTRLPPRSRSQAGGMLARRDLPPSQSQIPTRLAASSTPFDKASSSEPLPPLPKARPDRRSLPAKLCSSSSLSSPQADSHCGSFRLMGDGRLLGPFYRNRYISSHGRSTSSSSRGSRGSPVQQPPSIPEQQHQQQQQQQQQQEHKEHEGGGFGRGQPQQQQQQQRQSDSIGAGSSHAQGSGTAVSGSKGSGKTRTPGFKSRAGGRSLPPAPSITPQKNENPLKKAVRQLFSKLKLDKGHHRG